MGLHRPRLDSYKVPGIVAGAGFEDLLLPLLDGLAKAAAIFSRERAIAEQPVRQWSNRGDVRGGIGGAPTREWSRSRGDVPAWCIACPFGTGRARTIEVPKRRRGSIYGWLLFRSPARSRSASSSG